MSNYGALVIRFIITNSSTLINYIYYAIFCYIKINLHHSRLVGLLLRYFCLQYLYLRNLADVLIISNYTTYATVIYLLGINEFHY